MTNLEDFPDRLSPASPGEHVRGHGPLHPRETASKETVARDPPLCVPLPSCHQTSRHLLSGMVLEPALGCPACSASRGAAFGPRPVPRRGPPAAFGNQKHVDSWHFFRVSFRVKRCSPFFSVCSPHGNIFSLPCPCVFPVGRKLRGKAFYFVNGKVFCEEDFLVSMSPKPPVPAVPAGIGGQRPEGPSGGRGCFPPARVGSRTAGERGPDFPSGDAWGGPCSRAKGQTAELCALKGFEGPLACPLVASPISSCSTPHPPKWLLVF